MKKTYMISREALKKKDFKAGTHELTGEKLHKIKDYDTLISILKITKSK